MEKTVYKKIGQTTETVFVPLFRNAQGMVCYYQAKEKRIGFSTKKEVQDFLSKQKEKFCHFIEVRSSYKTYIPLKIKQQ